MSALYVTLPWLLLVAALTLGWLNRARLGWQIPTYLAVLLGFLALGMTLVTLTPFLSIPFIAGAVFLALAAIALVLGIIEFAILPLLGLSVLGAIARVTYYEALLQPFTIIIAAAGFAAMAIAAGLQYFTYNEDFKMFRDVAASFVFLFSLPIMIFASTKVIDEEIENRTMLTLMSKPVARWQVILGKYLGVLLLALVSVTAFGILAGTTGYIRYFDDMQVDYRVASSALEVEALNLANTKAVLALLPGLVLTFLQVATLAAVSVAVSTRYGLAVNVTTVVLIYIGANLARYVQSTTDLPPPFAAIATFFTYLLPGLTLLDLNQRLVFGQYSLNAQESIFAGPSVPMYAQIWQYVGLSSVYALFYIGAALSFGMALFRSRELS